MKRPVLSHRRNIGIISHIDAGKTTTTERILYYTGRVHRIGQVDEGSATTDWMSQERERGISITAAAVTTEWRDHEITIIDTPGHVDFTIEVERSLRVLDGAIAIFSAVEGVEPQSETVWRQADKFHVPRLVFINKLDRTGADFERTLEMIRERLGANVVVMQWPDGDGDRYEGQVDVLSGDYLSWSEEDEGREMQRRPSEGSLAKKAAELRDALIEAVADYDDALAESFLEGAPVDNAVIKKALRQAVLAGDLVPVYFGASLRNRGIQPLLNGVVDFLPSPMEMPPAIGRFPGEEGGEELRLPEDAAPFSAFVFKVQMYEGRRLTFFRVYSGRGKVGGEYLNTGQQKLERLARLFRMYSQKRDRIEEIGTGDIVAAAGMKWAVTGDTLCDPEHPVRYESISAPPPVISSAIEPRDAAGSKKLDETLEKLIAEDPTFHVHREENTGQILISGMGELHLDVLTHRIKNEFGVEVRVGQPRVVYRETVIRQAEAEGVFDRELAGVPQYARVTVRVAPALGEGVSCRILIPAEGEGGLIPSNLLKVALSAVEASTGSGVLAGYEMADVRAEITSADYDADRGTEGAFGVAAGNAFVEACRKAGGQLLEPVMAIEVTVPDEFVGAVIGDLNARDGQIGGLKDRGGSVSFQIVQAKIPLVKMFGYSTALRSATQGRATYTMSFSHYEPCEMRGI